MKEHAIKLVKDKQLSYEPIYNPKSMKLEIFKTYIKT